jgi:pimeloyl-ACP methyl ester carboxylesterase
MNWETRDIKIEGTKIHLHKNNNNKQPIIFLHGAMDNGLCFSPIAEKFSEKYRVIMPDLRGHGLTDTLEENWTYEAMAEDINKIIEILGLNNVILIGHSMGGNIAAKVAQKFPDAVERLVLEDPGFMVGEMSWIKKAFYKFLMRVLLKLLLRGDSQKIFKRGKERNPKWSEEELKPWAESKVQFKNQNPKKLIRSLIKSYNWEEIVEQIKCPTLLITSEEGIMEDGLVKKVLELNENVKWIKIDSAGHNIRRENMEDYLSAVKFFLKD